MNLLDFIKNIYSTYTKSTIKSHPSPKKTVIELVQDPEVVLCRPKLVKAFDFVFTSQKDSNDVLVTQDMYDALKKLELGIKDCGGELKINALSRSWEKQQHLVDLHNADVEAHKLDPSKPIIHAYAAPPGGSYHQARRAIDISLGDLKFTGLEKKDWVSKLWSVYKPLGFTPIISSPDFGKSEAWHADYRGPWQHVRDKMGNVTAAKCAILDVGNWNPKESPSKVRNMFIQAQLLRLGQYDIGDVDGIIGKKTQDAIRKLGIVEISLNSIALILSRM